LKTRIASYDIPAKAVVWGDEKHKLDVVVNTIPPDTVMNFAHGELPFVGWEFHKFILPIAHAFPKDVYFLYYAGNESYTRFIEYKQFTRQNYNSPSTIIGMEIPKLNAGRFCPMPIKSEYACAQKYFDDMPDGLFSIGRAGSYAYPVDIDDCIDQAMKVAEDLGQ
jgi:UDP-galactopyranose mutase